MRILVLICILIVMSSTASLVSAPAVSNVIVLPEKMEKLSAGVKKRGHLGIIVGLKLPTLGFRPEGTLSPEEIEHQRKAITEARKALVESLSCYDIEVYRIYTSIPYIAMKVNADALNELVSSPYVISIEEDSPVRVHDNNTPENVEEDPDANVESTTED